MARNTSPDGIPFPDQYANYEGVEGELLKVATASALATQVAISSLREGSNTGQRELGERISAIEEIGGLTPGNLTDATMTQIATNPDTSFAGVLDGKLSAKADADAVGTALDSKANASEMSEALAGKVSTAELESALANKADIAEVSGKANTADVVAALEGKVDLVNGALPLEQIPEAARPSNGERPVGRGETMRGIKEFGATGDGAADDSAAINAAIASDAAGLIWAAGEYVVPSGTNIAGLETKQHVGSAIIRKGSSTFYIGAKKSLNQRNVFYVSPLGSDTNDGMAADTPFRTLAKAAAAINAWADGGLLGLWRVQLSAGVYVQDRFLLNSMVKSDYPVEVRGPSVGGHPNVPTAIVDNSGGTSEDIFGAGYNSWLNVQDVKVRNQASGNAFHVSRGMLNLTNCHVENVYTGVVYEHGASLGLFGGLWNGANIPGGAGIRGYYSSTHNLVTPGVDTSALFNRWDTGLQIGEGTFGHLDYVRVHDCATGIQFNRVDSGANTKQMQIYRCSVGVQAWNSAWFNNGIDFGLGTPDACAVTVDERGDSPEYDYRVQDYASRTPRQMDTYRGANRTGNTNMNAEYTALTVRRGQASNATERAGHTTRISGALIANPATSATLILAFRFGLNAANQVTATLTRGASQRAYFTLELVSFSPTDHRMILHTTDAAGISTVNYKAVTVDTNEADTNLAVYYQHSDPAGGFSVIEATTTTTVGG